MAKDIPEKKVFCTDCPCRNTDYEQGISCNVGSDIEYKKIGNDFFYVSDDCILDVIRYANGYEFRPTLRAVEPPSALMGGGNSENSAGK